MSQAGVRPRSRRPKTTLRVPAVPRTRGPGKLRTSIGSKKSTAGSIPANAPGSGSAVALSRPGDFAPSPSVLRLIPLGTMRHCRAQVGPKTTPENASLHAKHAKNGPKTRSGAHLDALMGNSLPTATLIREILYSHSLPRCAILVNLSQKIAKCQANIRGSRGRFQANICRC